MFIQVLCDFEMKPWTGELSSEVSDTNAVVSSDASFQKLAAHVLQVRQQQEVSRLKDVLYVLCRQPNFRGVNVVQNALESAGINAEVDASFPLVFRETAIIAEQCPETAKPSP